MPSVYQEFHSTKHISNGTIRRYRHETPIAPDLPSIPKPVLAPGRVHKMDLQSTSYSETHYSCGSDPKGHETSSITTESISSTSISTTSVSTSLLSSLSRPPAVASFSSPCPSSCSSQPSTETIALESNTSTTTTATTPSDVVQHCLLFPTYATRHSRSGTLTSKTKSQASFQPPKMFLQSETRQKMVIHPPSHTHTKLVVHILSLVPF